MEIKYTEQELNSIDKSLLIKMFLNLQNQMETLTVETKALNAPVTKPTSPPKLTPAKITTAAIGFICGRKKKAILPAIASAQSDAIIVSSITPGRSFSK